MKPDPVRRDDGLCAVCESPLPERPDRAYATEQQYATNPFCSRPCCERWHGLVSEGAGLCECGCGRPAPIAPRNDGSKGHIKGQPMRYIQGHTIAKVAA